MFLGTAKAREKALAGMAEPQTPDVSVPIERENSSVWKFVIIVWH